MTQSSEYFARANRHMPGGVNSPVRAFKGVLGEPLFFERGEAAYLYDVDGNQYIDYIGSWGPLILGHAHPKVLKAVTETAACGLSFGAPSPLEVDMADTIADMVPNADMVRMVNSGTEATMTAIRLARGFTGRNKIIKFSGCYHGHSDSLLVQAGSGILTLGIPSSPGVPESITQHTLVAPYNDLEATAALFKEYANDIAAIIVEPIAGNMGCIMPKASFLQGLRELCDANQSVLIFDEVMTGFRVAQGGAQQVYQVDADLITLGKIIGGGMPVGAIAGKRAIMEYLAPLGPVYQAGTLSGNPVAMSAGLATLNELKKPGFYSALSATTQSLMQGFAELAVRHDIPLQTTAIGGMMGFFFSDKPVRNLRDVNECNIERFKLFHHAMLQQGIYLAPSAFEAGFVSSAHTDSDIQKTLSAVNTVFKHL